MKKYDKQRKQAEEIFFHKTWISLKLIGLKKLCQRVLHIYLINGENYFRKQLQQQSYCKVVQIFFKCHFFWRLDCTETNAMIASRWQLLTGFVDSKTDPTIRIWRQVFVLFKHLQRHMLVLTIFWNCCYCLRLKW